MDSPILVLQMQRMGDLVMTFPLLGWLMARYPTHPVWVVGEKHFFEPLLPLSPNVTYFTYDDPRPLQHHSYYAVINLSHREEAARIAGMVKTDFLAGQYYTPSGDLHVKGSWQLYRSSLTGNNTYNLYHWADLNALDIIPTQTMYATRWPLPRPFTPNGSGNAHIGLFLGASEPDKRPDPEFWVALTRQLLHEGARPVLLGGEAEKGLGYQVSAALGAHSLNLCGHFTVNTLASFIAGLDLLITPDTGPMHIATWTGTPVLNISVGPVNPWETGPFVRGHHVLRSCVPCLGCWSCTEPATVCKQVMRPRHVGQLAIALLNGEPVQHALPVMRNLLLARTRRDSKGLFGLETLFAVDASGTLSSRLALSSPRAGANPPQGAVAGGFGLSSRSGCAGSSSSITTSDGSAYYGSGKGDGVMRVLAERQYLSRFWREWFGAQFGIAEKEEAHTAMLEFMEHAPELASLFREGVQRALVTTLKAVKSDRNSLASQQTWGKTVSLLQPLSNYCLLHAENENSSLESARDILGFFEELHGMVSG